MKTATSATRAPRLPKAERRRQLMETARRIVREDGADRLTLGHLAERAGLSKPVVYDHFATRSILLVELYRWLDRERIDVFREGMAVGPRTAAETVTLLAEAFIRCAADTSSEVPAIGAALTGSEEKAAVLQELFDHCVGMFVAVLQPQAAVPADELGRRCIGLVGAGEALAAATVRGQASEAQAVAAFVSLIEGAVRAPAA